MDCIECLMSQQLFCRCAETSRAGSNAIDRRTALLGAGALSQWVVSTPSRAWAEPVVLNENAVTVPTWTLEGDVEMPVLALNTVSLNEQETERAVRHVSLAERDKLIVYEKTMYEYGWGRVTLLIIVRLARAAGITHIDFHPGKERDGVAQVIKKDGREGLFLNTK
eukprot:4036872-Pyramimonas_sp.AAC.2